MAKQASRGWVIGGSLRVAVVRSTGAPRRPRRHGRTTSIVGCCRIRPERLRGPPARRRRPPRRRHRGVARRLPPRPDERRQPQPLRVHAGRRARRRHARPSSAWSRPRSTTSTWTSTPASTRGSAPSTSSRSCRSATRRWTTASSWPARSGERIATRFDLPVYLYAQAATRPDRVKLADVRRGQYEGLKAEIDQHGREPDFGPARMHPRPARWRSAPGRSSSPTTSTSTSDDVELAKRIARRVRESGGGLPEVQAQRVLDRGARAAPRSR